MRSPRFCFAILVLLLAAASTPALSQQSAAETPKASSVNNLAPKHYYRLSYVLRESDEGKLINQRSFVVTINPEGEASSDASHDAKWWSLRAGTRVPYASGPQDGPKTYNYADVGMDLDSRGYDSGDALQLEVSAEIKSLGSEGPTPSVPQPAGSLVSPPVIRQVKVHSAVLAPFNKPTMVFTADDPATKHRFELNVTPVRER